MTPLDMCSSLCRWWRSWPCLGPRLLTGSNRASLHLSSVSRFSQSSWTSPAQFPGDALFGLWNMRWTCMCLRVVLWIIFGTILYLIVYTRFCLMVLRRIWYRWWMFPYLVVFPRLVLRELWNKWWILPYLNVFPRSVLRENYGTCGGFSRTRTYFFGRYGENCGTGGVMLPVSVQMLTLLGRQLLRLKFHRSVYMGFFALFTKTKKVRRRGASRVRHWARTPAHPRRRLMALMIWSSHGCSYGRAMTRSSAVVMCGACGWSLPRRSTTSSGRTRVGVSGSPLGCHSPGRVSRRLSRVAWSFSVCSAVGCTSPVSCVGFWEALSTCLGVISLGCSLRLCTVCSSVSWLLFYEVR